MAAISSNRLGLETQTLSNSSASTHTVSFELQVGGTWAAKSNVNGVFSMGGGMFKADRNGSTAYYFARETHERLMSFLAVLGFAYVETTFIKDTPMANAFIHNV
jgi:hypothetical protein